MAEINAGEQAPLVYSKEDAAVLKERQFDRFELGARGLPYERLDQLTVDLLVGVR